MATTYQRTCRRCSGTGTVCGGWCFNCWGATTVTVTVYTKEEKAERSRYATRRQAAWYTVKDNAKRMDDTAGLTILDDRYQEWSLWGFDRLESDEPERFARMLDSIDNGRLHDVIIALATYAKSHAN